jgi:hypothetical protein
MKGVCRCENPSKLTGRLPGIQADCLKPREPISFFILHFSFPLKRVSQQKSRATVLRPGFVQYQLNYFEISFAK